MMLKWVTSFKFKNYNFVAVYKIGLPVFLSKWQRKGVHQLSVWSV